MPTYVDNFGRCRVPNIALTLLIIPAGIASITSLVTISMPYWSPAAIAFFAPPASLVAFAATPIGMGILAGFAALFALVAVLTILQVIANNEISEMKGPKVVLVVDLKKECNLVLQVTKEDYEHITTNYQKMNEQGQPVPDEFCIGFTRSEGKKVRIIGKNNEPILSGNYVGLLIASVEVKDSGNYVSQEELADQLRALGLGTGDDDETVLSITPRSKVKKPKAEDRKEEKVSAL